MQIPEEIKQGMEWDSYPSRKMGGQFCGIPTGLQLTHKELGFHMHIDGFRSQGRTKEFIHTIFELYLEELKIK